MVMEARSTSSALAVIESALESVDHAERASLPHRERLELVEKVRRARTRIEALEGVLVGEADRARSSVVAKGTPTTSWLQGSGASSRSEAAGLVFTGRDLAARPTVQAAALAGVVSVRQARAIAKVLGNLPVGLTVEERAQAEGLLVAEAAHADADHLARMGQQVLQQVAPQACESPEAEQRRLEAQRARAHAARCLSFTDDGDGSWRVAGLVPHLQAASLVKWVDARVEAARRAQRDAGGGRLAEGETPLTPSQRRADALCSLAADLVGGGPGSGGEPLVDDPPRRPAARPGRVAGDRPRVVVTLGYDQLLARAEQAGILDSGPQVTAGDLRRLCCDADLVPAVLGGRGEVLDYGRAVRLVPPGLRQALSLRDRGCVFPGCDAPDTRCEAHHLVPWWAGGPTSLANLVLLCPHHHALVEPPRFWSGPPPDRWQVRLDADGLPEFLPPRSLDPTRAPRWNARGRAQPP